METFHILNELGNKGIPFLFIAAYDKSELLVYPLNQVDPNKILYSVKEKTNAGHIEKPGLKPRIIQFRASYDDFLQAFSMVMDEISAGNTYLLNLTASTPIDLEGDLRDIFLLSNAPYRLWLKDRFVVFSPESFITIRNNTISSFPMKGTIRANIEHAREKILADPKEAAEHATIVDLIRNDLSRVAKNVYVQRYRYVERVETARDPLLQVSSEICGTLPSDWNSNIGNILLELLPAGSVTGAPKQKTLEIIKRAENHDRGFYTGVFGIFDGSELETAVMIRFIEKSRSGYVYKSGGGITFMSEPGPEFGELCDKIYLPFVY